MVLKETCELFLECMKGSMGKGNETLCFSIMLLDVLYTMLDETATYEQIIHSLWSFYNKIGRNCSSKILLIVAYGIAIPLCLMTPTRLILWLQPHKSTRTSWLCFCWLQQRDLAYKLVHSIRVAFVLKIGYSRNAQKSDSLELENPIKL